MAAQNASGSLSGLKNTEKRRLFENGVLLDDFYSPHPLWRLLFNSIPLHPQPPLWAAPPPASPQVASCHEPGRGCCLGLESRQADQHVGVRPDDFLGAVCLVNSCCCCSLRGLETPACGNGHIV